MRVPTLSSFLRFFGRRRIYVDLGANIGDTVDAFARKNPAWDIYAFEPNPALAERLRARFKSQPRISIVDAAAAAADGTAQFYLGMDSDQSSTLLTDKKHVPNWRVDYSRAETVRTVDFAQWLAANTKPGDKIIVKMDIEGAEYDVLEKLIRSGLLRRIRKLKVEWHVDRYPAQVTQERHDRIKEEVARQVHLIPWA